MYELKAGLVKSKLTGAVFETKDLAAVPVKDLLEQYSAVYLILTHYAMEGDVTLSLRDAESRIVGLSTNPTVTEWLALIGAATLPTTNGTATVKQHNVLSRDAWQAGYEATLCVPLGSPLNDAPDSDKTDIWLTRPETDYLQIQNHCLATVNGLMHRLDADNSGAYIKDGGVTFARSNNAMIGLLSFLDVGEISTHSITPEMIYHPNAAGRLRDSAYITLPFDATGKVVGIVIAGYLHLLSNDVIYTGDKSIKVMMNKIPYLERYMESRYKMNMTALERFHQPSDFENKEYFTEAFYSDECIREMLTLSQSFLIEIKTDNLGVEYLKTENTYLPGRFYTHKAPLFPLRTQLGLLPSYVSFEEMGKWVICIDNNLHQQRVINTFDHEDRPIVTEARVSDEPHRYHRGDLVRYTREVITVV